MYTRGAPDRYKGKSLAKGNQLYKETPYKGKSLIQGNPLHVETLVKWNALGQPQEIPGKWKSLIQGNPAYREIMYTRGTPRKYNGKSLAKRKQLYKKPPIYGNSCQVNALLNKRSASTSEPFRGIKCTFENTKNHRENQRNQNNQRGQGKNYQQPSRKPNKTKKPKLSDPCRPKWTWVWKFWFLCFVGFLNRFWKFLPWPLWLFWFL